MHSEGEEGRIGEKEGVVGPAVSPLTPVGIGEALAGDDAVAVPRMAAGSDVDDGADVQGPSINGRER